MNSSSVLPSTNKALAVPIADVIVVGAGPAGLRAAEVLAHSGLSVDVYDAMPSVGRKFLLAGRGGLNLTHSEPFEPFAARYGERSDRLAPVLRAMDASAVRRWAEDLGVPTFVGSSGRVFPVDMKAAPLLRAWLHRLRSLGVRFHMRHRWLGLDDAVVSQGAAGRAVRLRFARAEESLTVQARACVLALGGASWSRLGSDGAWWPVLNKAGVDLAPLQPSNCGFDVIHTQTHTHAEGLELPGWTAHFSQRHAGAALKNVALRVLADQQEVFAQAGEFVVTQTGVEGSLIYAASAHIREQINQQGRAVFLVDLLPMHSHAHVVAEVARPRGSRSLSTHLKSRLGLTDVKASLLYEVLSKEQLGSPPLLAAAIKALPIKVLAPRPIDEAISTAGGVRFEAMNERGMLKALPGVFCAGEMLDWEAPTGGYLLTACMASGQHAAEGAMAYCREGA
ncbi:MAG: TIGR03862 family flavoprotein [Rhizobacter sp.]